MWLHQGDVAEETEKVDMEKAEDPDRRQREVTVYLSMFHVTLLSILSRGGIVLCTVMGYMFSHI